MSRASNKSKNQKTKGNRMDKPLKIWFGPGLTNYLEIVEDADSFTIIWKPADLTPHGEQVIKALDDFDKHTIHTMYVV